MVFVKFSKQDAKVHIKELIEDYVKRKNEGRLKKNDEDQIKQTFIQPLFEFLGWKVNDTEEVKMEEEVGRKEVDYA